MGRASTRMHARAIAIALVTLLGATVAPSAHAADTELFAQSTVTRDTSAPVSATLGDGITTWQFEREVVALAGDTCAAWTGAWVALGPANVAGPTYSDQSLGDGTCVRYRIRVGDAVGNEQVVEQVGELKVDRTAPVAALHEPTVPLHGTVTLTGTASDATTRVRSVAVVAEDRYSICASATLAADGTWSCTWMIGPQEVGAATITVTATDSAGVRTSASRQVTIVTPPSPFGPRDDEIDTTAPVVGLARMPRISWSPRVRVKASAYDDRPGVLDIRVEQRFAAARAVRFSRWAPSFEESAYVTLEDRGETTCFRASAVDAVGNRRVSDPRCTTLPLDDLDLVERGRWQELRTRAAYHRSLRRATRRGASLSVRIADPTPALVVTRCRGCGVIRVYHGRRIVGTWSLASRRTMHRRLIRLRPLRRPTSAALRIVSMSARPVLVDGLVLDR